MGAFPVVLARARGRGSNAEALRDSSIGWLTPKDYLSLGALGVVQYPLQAADSISCNIEIFIQAIATAARC